MAQLVKNPPARWETWVRSIAGLGRSPGEGKGYPLQFPGLENSMHCIDHGVTKSQTQLSEPLTIMIVWGNKLEAFHLFQCSEAVCLLIRGCPVKVWYNLPLKSLCVKKVEVYAFFWHFLFYFNFFSSLLAQSDFHLLKPSLVIYIPLENNPFHLGSTFIAININTKCQLFITLYIYQD